MGCSSGASSFSKALEWCSLIFAASWEANCVLFKFDNLYLIHHSILANHYTNGKVQDEDAIAVIRLHNLPYSLRSMLAGRDGPL